MLRAILFPYANYFIKQRLNSQINRRFAKEFAKLVLSLSKIVRIIAELDPIESYKDEKKKAENDRKNTKDVS